MVIMTGKAGGERNKYINKGFQLINSIESQTKTCKKQIERSLTLQLQSTTANNSDGSRRYSVGTVETCTYVCECCPCL